MKITITIPDQTYEWLAGTKAGGTPEDYIAGLVGANLRALMFQQPTADLQNALDAVNALCKPTVTSPAADLRRAAAQKEGADNAEKQVNG